MWINIPWTFTRLTVFVGIALHLATSSFAPLGLSSQGEHMCWITTELNLYCYGKNTFGEVGTGGNAAVSPTSPALILSGIVSASLGYAHTCAVNQVGELYCWGWNQMGQLGDGCIGVVVSIVWSPPAVPALVGVVSVSCGQYHTCALMLTGGIR